jgi:D-inositol-3-phosphate glycosyltransferase
MRILVGVHYFAPHVGGIEVVAWNQAHSLARRGHRVTVLTSGTGTREEDAVDGSVPFRVVRVRASNIIEDRTGVPMPLVGPWNLRMALREARNTDLVHIHDTVYLPCLLTGWAAIIERRPLIVTQHVALVDHPSRLVTGVQAAALATVGRATFAASRRVVAYNSTVRDFLIERGVPRSKIVLTRNGVDTDDLRPANPEEKACLRAKYGIDREKPVVLFVGRLVPKKGFDLVARAHTDAVTTLIAGRGEIPAELRRSGVRWHGEADGATVAELCRLADVFVMPTVGEVFTLATQEAMACGLALVLSPDPGYREYDLDPRLIRFVPRHPTAIAAAVREVVGDSVLREKMGVYSRGLAVDQFSWEANMGDLLDVYGQVTWQR